MVAKKINPHCKKGSAEMVIAAIRSIKMQSPSVRICLVLNRISRGKWIHPKKVEKVVNKMSAKLVLDPGARGLVRTRILDSGRRNVGIIDGVIPVHPLEKGYGKLLRDVEKIKEENNNFSGELASLEAIIRSLR